MKVIMTTIALLCTMITTQLIAQDYIALFKQKDFAAIEKVLGPDVNIKIDSNRKILGPSAVLAAIKQRLEGFAPVRIETKHKGSSEASERNYLIAKLYDANDVGIRLFINLENAATGRRICDIKIRTL